MSGSATLKDRLFQTAFARLPVYTILWEDAEVDARFLAVDDESTVLAISAAGCGVAGLLASRPRSIDAVDINPHHLALAALKCRAACALDSYEELYELFGIGRHARPSHVARRLSEPLPTWMRRYWAVRAGVFRRSVYATGLTARMLAVARRAAGIDEGWLRSMARLGVEARLREVDALCASLVERRAVRAAIESPLQLVTLGINFAQRDRLLESSETQGLAAFMFDHLRRVARTDLERNWFAWHAVAGRFNHGVDDAVPPYLRRASHERSFGAATETRFHNESILTRLAVAASGTWSHYLLCDAADWMAHDVQRRLFDEIHRTARDGAVVLYRSVEDASLVERHGLGDRFQLLEHESAAATLTDRSRQYRRVDLYRVAK